MKAVCVRCGAFKQRAMAACGDCAYRPDGAERPLSYLMSSHHLNESELSRAAARIRLGEEITPPPELLEIARIELTATQSYLDEADPDRGLSREEKFLLLLGDLLLTPLIGMVAWWGWRGDRPLASRQALRITVPVAIFMSAAWVAVVLF